LPSITTVRTSRPTTMLAHEVDVLHRHLVEPVAVDQQDVGFLADLEAADFLLEPRARAPPLVATFRISSLALHIAVAKGVALTACWPTAPMCATGDVE